MDSEAIQETARRINERLKKEPENKALKKAQKAIERDLPRMQKYEHQEELLENQRSYSKTDTDATCE